MNEWISDHLFLKAFFFVVFTLGVGQTVNVLPQSESVSPIRKCAEVQHRQ